MEFYKNALKQLPEFIELEKAIQDNLLPCMTVGLSHIHKAHFVSSISKTQNRPIVVITDDELSARKMCEDINAMLGESAAFFYPAKELTLREVETVSREYEHQRIGVLARIIEGKCKIIVASVEAALQHTIPPDELKKHTTVITPDGRYETSEIVNSLIRAGYARRAQVDGVSQFSVRGGIIDFFSPHEQQPIRLELWGDEIDTLSYFEIDSQRRTQAVEVAQISPASEVLFDSPEHLKEAIIKVESSLKATKANEKTKQRLKQDIERIESGLEINSIDKYISVAYQKNATLLNYFENPLVFMSEFLNIKEKAKNFLWQHYEDIKILLEDGELCEPLSHFCDNFGEVQSKTQQSCVYLESFARSSPELKIKNLISVNCMQNSGWGGELKFLCEELSSQIAMGYCCVVLAGTAKAAATLASDLRANKVPADFVTDFGEIVPRKIYVLEGNLSAGFEYPDIRFSVIANAKTLNIKAKKIRKRKGEEIKSLADLSAGDLVVHVVHGIGIFDGINKLDLHGVVKDYIKIKYAGADTLFVPVTQLDLVSKYIGPQNNGKIKLNKLNSGEWQKTRSRVKKAVAEMADELIKLYAERAKTKGFAFSEDNDWQKQFEEHFPYEETDDQLRCVEEIKADMQKDAPMDRLLCGDVGFGKTEVALRGAFKCMMDSKQCAILCPTTILAWQHYQNIVKRMEGFPITVELLSRFRSPKQQKEILKNVKSGKVDIVVGTHRLVQNDIEFKDLGLAIVDEEQRFGVAHKEKFKEMFRGIDMLTLSATPIPRTLNMAMSGIRDMSVIEEAPQDRHPVQTYVLEYDMGVLIDAMVRELRRGGQAYYIHNRIESIDLCAARIQAAIPDARVGIAHGRMSEEELSNIWRQLVENEIDILVCTTLIETGVDVANCNTLIIEDADKMGLSQLYQLRGRVGRSNRRAYAYFTFKRGKVLTEIAAKRLAAIREFTKFGSGFRIALRDLEIRGAGSILGARQHGHMEAVGYDMYLRLLSEAITEQKGEKPSNATAECLVDVQLEAHIPEKYIDNLAQRIDVYRKIASIRSEEDSMDLIDELIDRFGEPPNSVKGLIDVALLRNTAANHGFKEISQKGETILLVPERLDMELAGKMVAAMKGRVMVNASTKPYIAIKRKKDEAPIDTIREVLGILQKI